MTDELIKELCGRLEREAVAFEYGSKGGAAVVPERDARDLAKFLRSVSKALSVEADGWKEAVKIARESEQRWRSDMQNGNLAWTKEQCMNRATEAGWIASLIEKRSPLPPPPFPEKE